jgi:hypothetical protein
MKQHLSNWSFSRYDTVARMRVANDHGRHTPSLFLPTFLATFLVLGAGMKNLKITFYGNDL